MEIKSLKIPEMERISTGKVLIDNKNPNKMSKANFEALKKNIEKYGFIVPIITNEDYKIADGYHRWKAARELGMTEVSVIKLPLKEVDRRILRQVLNKLRGEHDLELDQEDFKFLMDEDALKDLEELLPELDLSIDLSDGEVEEDEFDVDKAKLKPKYDVKLGDVWQLGDHRLMCGDSIITGDVEILMNGQEPYLVFTDPPYGIDYSDIKGNHEKIINDHSLNNVGALISSSLSLACPVFICCNWKSYSVFESEMLKVGRPAKACIVWDKGSRIQNLDKFGKQHEFILYNGPFGGETTVDVDVWSISRETRKDHPTSKPLELCCRAIKHFKGLNVVDFFGGSGSTLIACEQLNRKCFMMEIDPVYCSVIIERWEKLTNKKAVKL